MKFNQTALVAAVTFLFTTTAQAHQTLSPVVVTANPLGNDINDIVAPVSVLGGDQLTQKQSSTLGETLNDLPGISSSNFGPNSSRPVIRGLDGDRVRIMTNGGANLDVSSFSADHAVAIEPLLVEQIEVVRGPAALQYGGSAIGGAVNIIDNRIPKAAQKGTDGRAEVRLGGAEMERAGAAVLNTGNGKLAIHADAAYRQTDDLRIPGNPLRSSAIKSGSRLQNTNADQQSGSVGMSATSDHGYAGLSIDSYKNDYGTGLFESGSAKRINMNQDRFTFAGEQRNLDGKLGFLSTLHGSMSYTDYKHDETKGSEVESTFKNKGWEAHIGGTHIPVSTALGQLKGAWGIQASESRLRMTSDHPLLPNSNTNTKAFFVFEELAFAKDKAVNFGARIEDVRVSALAGNGSESDESGAKKFKPFSSSLGYRQNLNKVWTATSNLSYTERAPTFYELFADGEHHATGSYEVGNVNQKKEKGRTLDVALNYKTDSSRARLGAFVSDFSNFIGMVSKGLTTAPGSSNPSCDHAEEAGLACYNYQGVKARLYGLEADGRFPIARGVMQQASQIDLAWKADYVRGEDRTNGTPLPRISPLRLSAAFNYTQGRYSSQFDVRHAASQNRYADGLGSTPSYTLLGMGASYRTKMPGLNSAYWFVRVDNLTNEVARNASSVMRDVTMAGSRAVRVGLRANF